MRLFVAAAALAGGLAFSFGASAQYDSAASRAENQVGSINRSITTQERGRALQQQNQFETNAIRNQITRPAPPPLVPSPMAAPLRR
ncbi:hypothetical protein [Enterovirga rhinocerotis]|uniref:Uncharacterized protein n=1 Tax=Enterovirga rhinocerotis TaxID=1339210 RepID=A0A4R7BVY0_9HYPH|nr:hypothetical protein [Enterovirga rhinocerotis]TDR88096.1 hypothetical protein EV668_3964 [Enterovirga rhinocerotis]